MLIVKMIENDGTTAVYLVLKIKVCLKNVLLKEEKSTFSKLEVYCSNAL